MSTSESPSGSQTVASRLSRSDLVTVVTVELEAPWHPTSPLEIPRTPRPVGGVPIRRRPLAEVIEHNTAAMRTRVHHWMLAVELIAEAEEAGFWVSRLAADPDADSGGIAGGPGAVAGSRRRAGCSGGEPGKSGRRRDWEAFAAQIRGAVPASPAIAGGPGADADFDGSGRGGRPDVSAGETGDDGQHRVAEASAGESRGRRRWTRGSGAARSGDAAGHRRPGYRTISAEALRLLGQATAWLSEAILDQAELSATARAGDLASIEAADVRRAAEIIVDVGTRRRIRFDILNAPERREGGA